MIDYFTPPLGYLVRIPCGDDAADSPLDGPARERAEQAAAFLRFERIGQIFAPDRQAARDAAEIVWHSCSWDFTDWVYAGGGAKEFCKFLLHPDRGLPCVLVATNAQVQDAIERLGISPAKQPGDADANVCAEIVAPGGVISLHRFSEIPSGSEGALSQTGMAARARTMVLDFAFTDFTEAVCAGADRGPSPDAGSGFQN